MSPPLALTQSSQMCMCLSKPVQCTGTMQSSDPHKPSSPRDSGQPGREAAPPLFTVQARRVDFLLFSSEAGGFGVWRPLATMPLLCVDIPNPTDWPVAG